MSKIDINYDDLSPAGYAHIAELQNQEDAIRRAVAGIGRSCSVRWLSNGAPTRIAFRLVAYGDRSDCIAEFHLPDFHLPPDSFAQLILAGERPCSTDL